MRNYLISIIGILAPILIVVFLLSFKEKQVLDNNMSVLPLIKTSPKVVDHSNFEVLQKDFATGPELTAACLSCHNQRQHEIMQTAHWKWERDEYIEGKGVVSLGKKNILNNFCIGVSGSEESCTRCHIGYGYDNKNFDFSEATNIDCLVCHDNTGTYKKQKGGAGNPDESVNLSYVAQNVGTPTRENCGVCHFWGGGGNNVKHGDLEKAMLDCSRDVDVHMTTDGANMTCVQCHLTENHQITGKLYALSSENKDRVTCEQCHGEAPHKDKILDDHIIRIACQTCHIPTYAKANSTKMIWDWSTAGVLDEHGEELHEYDQDFNHKYMSIKGTFVWDDHVVPEYYWFNGLASHQLIEDKIESVPVQMNTLLGCYADKGDCQESNAPSKIWPVKVHRGRQIYDPINMTLIQPKLHSAVKGEGAYWKDFDWGIASEKGMEYLNLPYSGEYDFVSTEMYWPLNHQVAPKEQSLSCIDCHTRKGGRLENLADFYLPARDVNAYLEFGGILFILLSLAGSAGHALCRKYLRKNC